MEFNTGHFISSGAQGKVSLFYDDDDKTDFAVKVFECEYSFQNEKGALEALGDCSNIVKLYNPPDDLHIPSSSLELVYYSNGDLLTFLEKLQVRGLREDMAKYILKQILMGCKNAHDRGYIHRDIKLENIFLDDYYCPHVGDFGLASNNVTVIGKPIGTPSYLAPEMFTGSQCDGRKVDVWAIGVLFFLMLTSNFPFAKEGPNEKNWCLRQLALKKTNAFWDYHQKYSAQPISPGAKYFFEKVFVLDPNQRVGIDDILDDDWLKLDIVADDEAYVVMESLNADLNVDDAH